jgi:hypothetical protein
MFSQGIPASNAEPVQARLTSAITIEKEYEMNIANKGQIIRRPKHPGEMLRKDFLRDFRLTDSEPIAFLKCLKRISRFD